MCSEAVWLVATVDIPRCDFSSLGGTPCNQPRNGGYRTLVYPELAMTRQNLTHLASHRGSTEGSVAAAAHLLGSLACGVACITLGLFFDSNCCITLGVLDG